MIYIDPPYGIKYGSNWQLRLDAPSMPESDPDDAITGEPEVIKAFRDTWELGIHSYLTYLQQRLLVAKELLSSSGSVFVQISSENVHLVRCLMDETFGSGCFVAEILVKKKGFQKGDYIQPVNDYVVWYSKEPKDRALTKFRPFYVRTEIDSDTLGEYKYLELPDGASFPVASGTTPSGEIFDYRVSPKRLFVDYPNGRLFRANPLTSGGERKNQSLPCEFEGREFKPFNK